MRRSSLIAVVLAVAGSLFPAGAVPPLAGGALASDNVDLVAHIGDRGGVGARILGDLLYETTATGLRIYDISNGVPIPQGVLPLPHFENENVSVADRPDGKRLALITVDLLVGRPAQLNTVGFPNRLFVIDVTNSHTPLLTATIATSTGHTIACVQGCMYAWGTGSGDGVSVIDLNDPASPREVGHFSANGCYGCLDSRGRPVMASAHNVNVDPSQVAWVSASNGLYAFDTRTTGYGPSNLLTPSLVAGRAGCGGCAAGPGFHDDFIIHNSMHYDAASLDAAKMGDSKIDPGELVLVTEENWLPAQNGFCADDGQFQTAWLHTTAGVQSLDRIGQFRIGQGVVTDAKKPAAVAGCSSHWFSAHGSIVADAWYEQGTRFLDVSDPYNIKQIGYYMPADTIASMALFHEVTAGPLPGLYVYVVDYSRGLDVLRFTGQAGAAVQLAPRYNVPDFVRAPSPEWGWACRINKLIPTAK
jgi:hypothetical protein